MGSLCCSSVQKDYNEKEEHCFATRCEKKVEDFKCKKKSARDNVWTKEVWIDEGSGTYKPAIPLTHIVCGQITKRGRAQGFHFRPNGYDPPSARASIEFECSPVIQCFFKVEVFDSKRDEYVPKKSTHNSFFPMKWTLEETIKEIEQIFCRVNENHDLKETRYTIASSRRLPI